jgi:hypothetical protein
MSFHACGSVKASSVGISRRTGPETESQRVVRAYDIRARIANHIRGATDGRQTAIDRGISHRCCKTVLGSVPDPTKERHLRSETVAYWRNLGQKRTGKSGKRTEPDVVYASPYRVQNDLVLLSATSIIFKDGQNWCLLSQPRRERWPPSFRRGGPNAGHP